MGPRIVLLKKVPFSFRPATDIFRPLNIFFRGSVGSSISALIKRLIIDWTVIRQLQNMNGVFPSVVPSIVIAIPGSSRRVSEFHCVSLQRKLLVVEDGELDCCKRFCSAILPARLSQCHVRLGIRAC